MCFKARPNLHQSCHLKCQVGASLVHAFAAFVLLSYNRLCQITVYLLAQVRIFDPHTLQTVQRRVFFQGDYLISDSIYEVRYKLPALLMTCLLIMVPVALLHYPVRWAERLILKVKYLKNVYPTASIAILLDAFQGCFKDNRRYFAGLYLALRQLLVYAYILPTLIQLLIQQILFIIYIVLLAVLKPYKDKRLNYLDIAMFANLAVINILTWFTVNQIEPDTPPLAICIVIESILVFLPMVYLAAYLLWYSTRRYHEGIMTKVIKWRRRAKADQQNTSRSEGIAESVAYTNITHVTVNDAFGSVYIDRSVCLSEHA